MLLAPTESVAVVAFRCCCDADVDDERFAGAVLNTAAEDAWTTFAVVVVGSCRLRMTVLVCCCAMELLGVSTACAAGNVGTAEDDDDDGKVDDDDDDEGARSSGFPLWPGCWEAAPL